MHIWPFPIGWLINRGAWLLPFFATGFMMIDGIPVTSPSMFTTRTSLFMVASTTVALAVATRMELAECLKSWLRHELLWPMVVLVLSKS